MPHLFGNKPAFRASIRKFTKDLTGMTTTGMAIHYLDGVLDDLSEKTRSYREKMQTMKATIHFPQPASSLTFKR